MMEVKSYIHLVFKKWIKIKISQPEQQNQAPCTNYGCIPYPSFLVLVSEECTLLWICIFWYLLDRDKSDSSADCSLKLTNYFTSGCGTGNGSQAGNKASLFHTAQEWAGKMFFKWRNWHFPIGQKFSCHLGCKLEGVSLQTEIKTSHTKCFGTFST